jgi:hypothetical protein
MIMAEETKIETQTKSFRLAVDVIGLLDRWAEETKQSATAVLQTLVRTAAEDEGRIAKGVLTDDSVLQEGEVGVGVLQIRMPRGRDELADAFTTLMFETQERIGEKDRISALGVARARVYKLSPEYQERKEREGEKFYSPYENEKELADKLSKSGGAGDYTAKMREKGEK